jgi:hypothetical protein
LIVRCTINLFRMTTGKCYAIRNSLGRLRLLR